MTKWTKALALASIALLALLPAGTAVAQEQVGSIEGTVTDGEGKPLPGVTVEAQGPAGTLVTQTNGNGNYRFQRVPPGSYQLRSSLESFVTGEASNIRVSLGQTASVAFRMQTASVSETITVVGESTGIDVASSSTATSISDEQIELLPKGRDFTGIVGQAAGAGNEAFLGGISIDGASGSENRFVIDGVDTTHPQDGVSGQGLITDFVGEVQVKSAGYAAEFGGSLGGVVNAVTKTGSNEFVGWVGAYYSDSDWAGAERPTPYESDPSLYRTFDKDDQTILEPGFALGGPIVRDHAWFYVGFMPRTTETDRTPDGSSVTYGQEIEQQYLTANLQGNVGSRLLYKLAGNLNPFEQKGNLPNKDGSTPADADLSITTKIPSESYSLYGDYIPTSSFILSGRVGTFSIDNETEGVDATTRIFFRDGNIPLPESDPLYRPNAFSSVPAASFFSIADDRWEREAASLDATWYLDAAGDHTIKGGAQYEHIANQVDQGENGNYFEVRWGLPDRFGMGVQGTYGSVGVRRFGTVGEAEARNLGFFLQDAWQPLPSLTLNLGVRTEKEEVPNYGARRDPTLPENAIEFDYSDKLAPRLGFAWDVLSDQKWKLYGSYGLYYDITKIEMPRGSFGADQWIQHVYPIETLDWTTFANGCTIVDNTLGQNPCPGLGPAVSRDLRQPTDPRTAIDPDLEPMEQREFQLGLDHQLTPGIVLGARYVNKELLNTIEDIGYLVFHDDGTSSEQYITGNPGKGLVAGDPEGPVPPQAEAIRDYQAVELSFDRRFDGKWSLRAGYTWSELEGNYSGLASSDEFGRTDPNVARFFDGLVYGYDAAGNLVEGPLNTDRPHAVEVQGLYRAPWGTNVGVNTSWRTGSPLSEQHSYNGVAFFPKGRNNLGRLDDLTQTDLLLTHGFALGGRFDLEVSLNVINLFDEDTVLQVGNQKYQEDFCDLAGGGTCDGTNDFYFNGTPWDIDAEMQGATLQPHFLKPLAAVGVSPYQAPRTVRLGVKFLF